MGAKGAGSQEAFALERVAAAARLAQVLDCAENSFFQLAGRQLTTLELAPFSASMRELKDASEAFDLLVVARTAPRGALLPDKPGRLARTQRVTGAMSVRLASW